MLARAHQIIDQKRIERKYEDKLEDFVEEFISSLLPTYSLEKHFERVWRYTGRPVVIVSKHGVKATIYPILIPFKIPANIYRSLRETIRHKNPHLLYLLPLETLRRDAAHASAYFVFSFFGMNYFKDKVDSFDAEKDVTGLDRFLDAANLVALKENERAIFIGSADERLSKNTYEIIIKKYSFLKDKLEYKSSHNNSEFLNHLSTMSGSKGIKYLFVAGHGSDGSLNFGQSSSLGVSLSSSFDSGDVEDLSKVSKDIFTDRSALLWVSCSLAEGQVGEEFLKKCSQSFSPPPSRTISSSKSLMVWDTEKQKNQLIKLRNELEASSKKGADEFFLVYAFYYPLMGLAVKYMENKSDKDNLFIFESKNEGANSNK
ncbi:MAG: DUF4347 domain-containing protein [Proteobacteria bacterium]|nr:DUF4347 domain-containing protein [Pseudomonadota bacterium]